ncbi:TraR/DksA family transcriptional regulator [Ideonella sp.]|uniref:TraR/DksA family transcriptional regulator n=1 Tax=Ideonella sp. TaxID=1929293 RepID=UPI002B49A1FE|nr:TraR/DksA family transcriptional regulator [Ideonella sp.]HJV72294.1 TraR/DksA family transcriptional regulator [Ideonella sp.]
MTALHDQDLARLRGALDARAAVLRAEVGAIDDEKADLPRSVPMSQVEDDAERGEERTREAMRHAEQERDIDELRAIAAALERMADGRYGSCVDCGIDIPLARLLAQPTASRCVPCQERFETSHRAVPRVSLPPAID